MKYSGRQGNRGRAPRKEATKVKWEERKKDRRRGELKKYRHSYIHTHQEFRQGNGNGKWIYQIQIEMQKNHAKKKKSVISYYGKGK